MHQNHHDFLAGVIFNSLAKTFHLPKPVHTFWYPFDHFAHKLNANGVELTLNMTIQHGIRILTIVDPMQAGDGKPGVIYSLTSVTNRVKGEPSEDYPGNRDGKWTPQLSFLSDEIAKIAHTQGKNDFLSGAPSSEMRVVA